MFSVWIIAAGMTIVCYGGAGFAILVLYQIAKAISL
jgi:hypothetical protein